ncbi:hypothetical protein [Algoriphagus machipongonensis]|uniref:Uncharacterized protein n=1 Tax=Algoriphagus machipongonensis TaxID=388413 RepID=A3HXV7_9BACT|nr:hypothetical protein [Algoriphagus machipongonensis]EAZ81430.1 hypothetical protein ALPR1_20378 [Algoriphagus machipongonensis]
MKDRIEELLEKYWEGESSLEEERELKRLLKTQEDFVEERSLFGLLEDYKEEEPKNLQIPATKVRKMPSAWLNWAASIAIVVSSFFGWRIYQQEQERQAYEDVMEAFAMIQNNLAKGQDQMEIMNDMKYLNTTNHLFGADKK